MTACGRFGGRLLFAVILVCGVVGCRSTQSPKSEHLASVLIRDKSIAQIEEVTQAVFKDNGYKGARVGPGEFVFEKQGTGMNTLEYGDWSTKKVWVRVKVYLTDLGGNQVHLECDAYMINERGDQLFEEEHKLTWVHRGKYQKLLEEIQKRLSFMPRAAAFENQRLEAFQN